MPTSSRYIYWFKDIDKEEKEIAGVKGVILGELVNDGFPVPNGFIVSSHAYSQFLRENKLPLKIKHLLETVNFERPESLQQVAHHIQHAIVTSEVDAVLIKDIFSSYRALGGMFKDASVAVKPSPTHEDIPTATLLGHHETFLNVTGEANLLLKIKEIWASWFNTKSLLFHHEKKIDLFRTGIAIIVQHMVEPDTAGIMYTAGPDGHTTNTIHIQAIVGLGELLSEKSVTPDYYTVNKNTLEISTVQIHSQPKMLKKVGKTTKEVKLPTKIGSKQKLTEKELKEVARLGKKLEETYFFPQAVEWAIAKNKISIIQSHQLTPQLTDTPNNSQSEEKKPLTHLLSGIPFSPGIATGPVRLVQSVKDLSKVFPGDIVVTPQLKSEYTQAIKKAAAIITEGGERLSQAITVARHQGIPVIGAAEQATKLLKDNHVMTVDGMKGHVHRGGVINSSVTSPRPIQSDTIKTATNVFVTLTAPEPLLSNIKQHADGIGMLKAESIFTAIGIHPKKLLREGKEHIIVDKLSEQLQHYAKEYTPHPVIYCLSDLRTSNYRELVGGKDFEPLETNPTLGYRGAYRMIHDKDIFALELEAIKRVRKKMELPNVWLMIPYIRTVKELIEVKKIISNADLHRSTDFKILMTLEIPSEILLLEEFIHVGIDGISINLETLTMLLLGIDPENSDITTAFDEQNPAVVKALETVIKTCQTYNIPTFISGSALTLHPSLLEQVVKMGITSVSVPQDAVESIRKHIANFERNR